jgi:hypothetical protein
MRRRSSKLPQLLLALLLALGSLPAAPPLGGALTASAAPAAPRLTGTITWSYTGTRKYYSQGVTTAVSVSMSGTMEVGLVYRLQSGTSYGEMMTWSDDGSSRIVVANSVARP